MRVKKLEEKGLKSILISNTQILGKYISKSIKDKSGEIILSAGFDITEEALNKIVNQGENSLEIVNVDPINKGPYLLETLKISCLPNHPSRIIHFHKF